MIRQTREHLLLELEGPTIELDGGSSNEAEDGGSKDSKGSNADHDDYQKGRERSTKEMSARSRLAVVGWGVLGVSEKSGFTSSLGGE